MDNKGEEKIKRGKFKEIFEDIEKYREFLIKEERNAKYQSRPSMFLIGLFFLVFSYFIWEYFPPVTFIFVPFGALLVFGSLFHSKKVSELTPEELRKSFEKRKKLLNWIKKFRK